MRARHHVRLKRGAALAIVVAIAATLTAADPFDLWTDSSLRIDGTGGAGQSVTVADVNCDGIPDFIIGETGALNTYGSDSGSVFVVFGQSSAPGIPGTLAISLSKLGTPGNAAGFRIDGYWSGEQAGFSVASADVNGDCRSDIIIGAPGATYPAQKGAVYVVLAPTAAEISALPRDPSTLRAPVKGDAS